MIAKTTLREIKSSIARYLAIFAIVALGVGFFAGLKMCRTDMVDTADEYLQKSNMYDYEILSSYGVDEDSVKIALDTPGVTAAETSMQKDIIVKRKVGGETVETTLKAISIPKEINKITVTEGRLPEKNNECVVDSLNNITKFEIGDVVSLSSSNNQADLDTFKTKKFKIVGKVNTPIFLDYNRGSTNIGNGSLDAFFFINRSAFDSEYSSHLYVTLDTSKDSFSATKKSELKKQQKAMDKLAERVTEGRRNAAQEEVDRILSEKRAQYYNGVAKYNREKAAAENRLTGAASQIVSGRALANKSENELRSTLTTLKSNQNQIESGLQTLEVAKQALDSSHDSGLINDDQYETYLNQYNAQIGPLKSQLAQVKSGIAQVNNALEQIKSKRKDMDKAEQDVNKGRMTAKTELAKAKAELERGKAALDEAEAQVAEMETGNSYAFSRGDNTGYSTFENNADIVSNVAKIFPVFFFLVAALVVMTTMTRMIDEQRSQIGVFRALGYSNFVIRNKYLVYSGSAALLGSIAGFFIGCNVFPMAIWKAYTMMYSFSDKINILYDVKLGLIATLAAMLCAIGATWFSCSREFREVPAELIRPKAPPAGKKILLERWSGLWNRLGFMKKVSLRNVFRYKKRFFMMLLGICGCTALLVAGLGIRTSISGIAEHQYSEIERYDYQIAFNKNMDADAQKNFKKEAKNAAGNYGDIVFLHQGTVDLDLESGKREMTLSVVEGDAIKDFVQLKSDGKAIKYPGNGEVALCRKMHDQCGVNIGDKVTIKDGYYKMTATVSAFYDNYVYETMYMNEATYKKGIGKEANVKTAYVVAPEKLSADEIGQQAANIGSLDSVAATVVSQDIIETVKNMMKSMNSIVYVVILCAGLLAFIVLYNLTNINILERIREIATIKVLGFYNRETAQYVFRENIILTVISGLVGLPLGKWLLTFVIDNIKIDMMFFVPKITALDFVLAFVITFIFTFIVNLVMRPKLGKISMTESLKTIE